MQRDNLVKLTEIKHGGRTIILLGKTVGLGTGAIGAHREGTHLS